MKISSYWSGGFDWGGEWFIGFGRHQGIKVDAVVSGECWLSLEGVPEPIHGRAGDCVLLPSGRPFRVGSNLALPPVDALTLFSDAGNGGIATHNGGGDFFGIGCDFTLAGDHASILLGVLPPIVHLRKESDKEMLRWCVERMRQELREPQPGGSLVAQQLATMMLVQALRLHLAEGLRGGVGWLFALADPRMRAAITAMHDHPAHRWTLQLLAKRAGMSRTTFAVKFKETVGKAPMEYLTHWRMRLAGDRLATSGDPISVIAPSLGYGSESAFSTAFERVIGCSPRQYCRGRHPAPPIQREGETARTHRQTRIAV